MSVSFGADGAAGLGGVGGAAGATGATGVAGAACFKREESKSAGAAAACFF